MDECFFWYRLTQVVPGKIHRAVKRLYRYVCVLFLSLAIKTLQDTIHSTHNTLSARCDLQGRPIRMDYLLVSVNYNFRQLLVNYMYKFCNKFNCSSFL